MSASTSASIDLLVIGGGIVGAGVARDAALRGLKVRLVDQADFASGTSSRSSRLLHGGLRYLEQGHLRLVREASREKLLMAELAPHLVQPLEFLFPIYKGRGRPLWQLRIGVGLYDLLCGGRNFKRSRGLSRTETVTQAPALDRPDLAGAAAYYDALTQDARLVIDTLRSAARAGAILTNYVRLESAQARAGCWRCVLVDRENGGESRIDARAVVNASGPWAGTIPHSKIKLRLSKGVHLILPRETIPLRGAVVITEGKRILFVLPWGKRTIVGTTDTDYDGPPEEVRVDDRDIAYILQVLSTFFPGHAVGRRDILSGYAGVRPLIADPGGSPSDISRSHQIRSTEPGWWDVAGGKLTTYRKMAEETVDRIGPYLGTPLPPCRTALQPLLPAEDTSFSRIIPVEPSLEATRHYVRSEWARHLDDVMIRRSGWHYYEEAPWAVAESVSRWMGSLLGWTEERRKEEVGRYLRLVAPWRPQEATFASEA